jgi:hypothetical protein
MIEATVIEKNEKNEEMKFPCLMVNNDNSDEIIYFSEYGSGVVITGERSGDAAGYAPDNSWDMSDFQTFTGTVTLRNK